MDRMVRLAKSQHSSCRLDAFAVTWLLLFQRQLGLSLGLPGPDRKQYGDVFASPGTRLHLQVFACGDLLYERRMQWWHGCNDWTLV